MKVDGNRLRGGHIIEHKGRMWRVVRAQHVKPGKGGAFAQVELRDIINGTKLNERFRAAETLELIRLERVACQFLYRDGERFVFMNNANFEQIDLGAGELGSENIIDYLQDGMAVEIEIADESPVGVVLPEQLSFEVTETESVVKGQTQTSSYKPGVLSNGMRVLLPSYIRAGDRVVIATSDGSFVERERSSQR